MNELFAHFPGFNNGRARVSPSSDSVILLVRDGRRLEGVGDGVNRGESEGNRRSNWSLKALGVRSSSSGALCIGVIGMLDNSSRARGELIWGQVLLPVWSRVLLLKCPTGEVPIEIHGVWGIQLVVDRVEAAGLLNIPMH